jgi:hypothetical protein
MTATRQQKGSDQAYSVTLTTKISTEQYARLVQATRDTPVSTWLRAAVVRALDAPVTPA